MYVYETNAGAEGKEEGDIKSRIRALSTPRQQQVYPSLLE
jgi:hypothetical protein